MNPIQKFFNSINKDITQATSNVKKGLNKTSSNEKTAPVAKPLIQQPKHEVPGSISDLKVNKIQVSTQELTETVNTQIDSTLKQLSLDKLDKDDLQDSINIIKDMLRIYNESNLGQFILGSDISSEQDEGSSGYSSLDFDIEESHPHFEAKLNKIDKKLVLLQMIEANFENPRLQLILKNKNINCDDPNQRIENLNRHIQNIIEQEDKQANPQNAPKVISKEALIKEGLKIIPKPKESTQAPNGDLKTKISKLNPKQQKEMTQIFKDFKRLYGNTKIPDETETYMIDLFTSNEDAKEKFKELIKQIEYEVKIAKESGTLSENIETINVIGTIYDSAMNHNVSEDNVKRAKELKDLLYTLCDRNFIPTNSQAITDELPVLINPQNISLGTMQRSNINYKKGNETSNLEISGFRECTFNTFIRNQFSNNLNEGGSTVTQKTTVATVNDNEKPAFIRFSSQLILHDFSMNGEKFQTEALTELVRELSNINLNGEKNAYDLWLKEPKDVLEKFGTTQKDVKTNLEKLFGTEIPDEFVEWFFEGCNPEKKKNSYDQLYAQIDQLILDISNFSEDASIKYFKSLNMLTST